MTVNEFDKVFIANQKQLLRSLTKLTFDKDVAYDLLMESYVKLRTNLEAVTNNKSIAGLLFIAARNTYISSKRKEKKEKEYKQFVRNDVQGNDGSRLISHKVYSIANNGFNDKNHIEKVVLDLYYEKDLSFHTIAKVTNVSRYALMKENKRIIDKLAKDKTVKGEYYE